MTFIIPDVHAKNYIHKLKRKDNKGSKVIKLEHCLENKLKVCVFITGLGNKKQASSPHGDVVIMQLHGATAATLFRIPFNPIFEELQVGIMNFFRI